MKSMATVAAAILVVGGMTANALRAQPAGSIVPGKYIVQLREGVTAAAAARRHGVVPDHVYGSAVNGYAGTIPPGLARLLEDDPDVVSIVPDRVVTLVGKPTPPTPPPPAAQVLPAGVWWILAAPGDNPGCSGKDIGVAIVDTGIDLNHEDLAAVSGYNAIKTSALAQDDNGHGTHVAGIVAALDNTIDVVGVAPMAKLYAVKVLNSRGSGTDTTVIAGLNWIVANAIAKNIKVANLSLGRPGTLTDNPSYRAAIQKLTDMGVTVVVAAGNNASVEVKNCVPAGYPEVIAVASSTVYRGIGYLYYQVADDAASIFTTDGAYDNDTGIGVTISAPGEDQENVSSALRVTSIGILSTKLGGGTTRMAGTSMAAPHVAGVAALLHEKVPEIDPEEVRTAIMAGARGRGYLPYDGVGAYTFDGQREGILLAPAALQAAGSVLP